MLTLLMVIFWFFIICYTLMAIGDYLLTQYRKLKARLKKNP